MKKLAKLKAIAFIAAALFFTTQVKAQITAPKAFDMSIGLDAADPLGKSIRLGSNFVLGGTIQLQYGLSNNFAIIGTGGAYHFFAIIDPATGKRFQSFGQLPFMAGIKDFFAPNFYLSAQAGAAFEEDDSGAGPTRLLLSPAVGFACKHWDIGVHYDNFSSTTDHFGLIGVRIAYAFKL